MITPCFPVTRLDPVHAGDAAWLSSWMPGNQSILPGIDCSVVPTFSTCGSDDTSSLGLTGLRNSLLYPGRNSDSDVMLGELKNSKAQVDMIMS